ncbi:MAG: ABC transporter permease subunit [Fervidicoccaceae archaeon]
MLISRKIKNSVFIISSSLLALLTIIPALSLLVYISYKGAPVVFSQGINFLIEKPASVTSATPGGIAPALLGTIYLIVSSTLISAPVAILAAAFVVEFPRSPISRMIKIASRTILEIASITVGMLAFFLIVLPMGRFTAAAGTVALAVLMIPYVYTYTETALTSVPQKYIEAAYSIGMRRSQVFFKVTSKIAWKGIARGIFVGIMKISGETAPLIFTIFGARNSLFSGINQPIDALPLMIFQFIQTGFENWKQLAWGGAFVLLLIYIVFYIIYFAIMRDRK